MDSFEAIADLARKQSDGNFSTASDAMTALMLIERLARLLAARETDHA